MKILIVDQFLPYPPADGGALRVFNLLKQVSQYHEVSFLTLVNGSEEDRVNADYLRQYCRVELVVRQFPSIQEHRRRQVRAILRREPMRNLIEYSEELAVKIRSLTERENFDIIDIQRPISAPYIHAISLTKRCRKILTMYDVPYVQYHRIMSSERNWNVKRRVFMKDWLFSKQAIVRYGRLFDKCVLVSQSDRDILKKAAPDLDIAVIPNGVDVGGYSLLAESSSPIPTLLFVGKMNYAPNVDGALFFCEEILPLIKQQVSDIRMLIVGQQPKSSIKALVSENVIVTGFVESVIPYYQQAIVSVVPLRSGGGTRLKILESMALGRPVVSTTLGCEGLRVTHEENILIADTPEEFARQTIRLLRDDQLRQCLIQNGRRLVESTYDWEAIAQQMLQIYDEALINNY